MKPPVKWGLILGIFSIIHFVTGAVTGLGFSSWYGWLGLPIGIIILVLGVKEARELSGNDFPFGKAFGTAFQIILISTVLTVLFMALYVTVINADYFNQMANYTAGELAKSPNIPEDAVEAQVEGIRNNGLMFMLGAGLIGGLVLGAIEAAIIAAIMKREEKIAA